LVIRDVPGVEDAGGIPTIKDYSIKVQDLFIEAIVF